MQRGAYHAKVHVSHAVQPPQAFSGGSRKFRARTLRMSRTLQARGCSVSGLGRVFQRGGGKRGSQPDRSRACRQAPIKRPNCADSNERFGDSGPGFRAALKFSQSRAQPKGLNSEFRHPRIEKGLLRPGGNLGLNALNPKP